MGEYADTMIEGDVCMVCGVLMAGGGNGVPRSCGACRKAATPDATATKTRKPKTKEAKRRKRFNYRRNVKARLALAKEVAAGT